MKKLDFFFAFCQACRSVWHHFLQLYALWRQTTPAWGARFEISQSFMEQLSAKQKNRYVVPWELCLINLPIWPNQKVSWWRVFGFCFFFCLLMLQISAAISEMSEANKDLLEKYRKEVALRRKYHEQLVELKGITLKGSNWPHQVKSASLSELPVCRQHSRAVSREASAKGGPARRGPLGGRDDGPQQRVLALGAEQRKGSHLWNGQNLPPTVHTGRGNKDDTCKGSTAGRPLTFILVSSGLPGDWTSCDVLHRWIPRLHICLRTDGLWKNLHYGGKTLITVRATHNRHLKV